MEQNLNYCKLQHKVVLSATRLGQEMRNDYTDECNISFCQFDGTVLDVSKLENFSLVVPDLLNRDTQ